MTKAAELAKIVDASGNVVTSGTVEPAGDTAAGDNAAIGFTSAEGIVITGQGSTNDVTIKNDADADVIEIPTGTTNVTVAGTLTATGFIIGSADINENDLESIDGITAGTIAASKAAIVDTNKDITGFRNITLTGELDAATLDISGNADIDGTLEADAITVNGTALATVIAGTTVTTATNANHVSVADNESTNEENLIPFIEDASATGNVGLESDGDFAYNPSTGTVSATVFKGNIDAVDGDFDGTLEADAITIGGTAIASVLSPVAGSSSIVTTGALNSGSITSGFGTIDTGSSTITTTGAITGGSLVVDEMTLNADTLTATDTFTIDSANIITLDSAFSSGDAGGIIRLADAGTQFGDLHEDSGNFLISSAGVDKDLIFKGNDGGSIITALTLDMSDGGRLKTDARANINGATDFGILTVAANTTAMDTNSNHQITLENTSQTTSAKGLINYKTAADSGSGFIPVAFGGRTINPANATRTGAFVVYVADTDNVDIGNDEKMRIHHNGVASFNNGIALGVGTANTASNVLEDYEEGTWTPVLAFGGGTTGIGYGQQFGNYTKIGRLVHIKMRIVLSSKGSSTGEATISGFPFNPADDFSSVSFEVGKQFDTWDTMATSSNYRFVFTESGSMILAKIDTNSTSSFSDRVNNADFNNASDLRLTFTYTA
jgi:cytoskeletal protein CcmA (bactofilin family)